MALLEKGLVLDGLGRCDEAIETYDELLGRFSETDDQKTLEHVAWAMYDMARAVRRLGREEQAAVVYEELIDRFSDSRNKEIRPLVSWSLWSLYMLGRRDEEAVSRALVERGDDEFDVELRDRVLFAYCTLGALAGGQGDSENAFSLLDAVTARAGSTRNPAEQVQVHNALTQKAYVLERLGRYEDAVAVYDDVIPRLVASAQRERAFDVRRRRAIALDRAGHSEEALGAYDDALGEIARVAEPFAEEQAFRLLTGKALTLWNLTRGDEALLVSDGALRLYRELDAETAAAVRAIAIRVVLEKVELLCAYGRSDQAGAVEGELVGLLGDVTAATPVGGSRKLSDEQLASLLAEVHAGDCWQQFDHPPSGAAKQLEGAALDLYRRTDPLLEPPTDWDGPAVAAATLIRQVADGFALLSDPPASSNLALPQRQLLESAIRRACIDEWAADHGNPLELGDDGEDIQALLDAPPEPERDDCAATCVAAFYQRDLIATLCDSETGREALHGRTHRLCASRRLNTARQWGSWAFAYYDDAQPAAAAAILVAQAYYRATRERLTSSELTPSRATLCELLRQTEGTRWLEQQDLALPDWLTDD